LNVGKFQLEYSWAVDSQHHQVVKLDEYLRVRLKERRQGKQGIEKNRERA
jgi:hypothetical protein